MAKDWTQAVKDDLLARHDSHECVRARWESLSRQWDWPAERIAAVWHEGRQKGWITTFPERLARAS